MAESRLRSMLSLKSEDSRLFNTYNDELSVELSFTASAEEIVLALIEDYKHRHFAGYKNLCLVSHIDRDGYEHLEEISMEKELDNFTKKLNELYKGIKRGRFQVFDARAGENWRINVVKEKGKDGKISDVHVPSYDLLAVLNPVLPSYLTVTPRTKTAHLTPFIDGKIEGKVLAVYDKGREVIREPVTPEKKTEKKKQKIV